MRRYLFVALTLGLSISLNQPSIAGLGTAGNKVQRKFEAWCGKKYNKCSVSFTNYSLSVSGGDEWDGIYPSQMLSFSSETNTKVRLSRRLYNFIIRYQEDGNNLTGTFIFSDPKVATSFRNALIWFCPNCKRYGNWVGL